uniref:Uncharacterized protein n=1 Tax=Anguilla anguilla TaxID=7936 RepID=A0A0E9U8A1_ANGAN
MRTQNKKLKNIFRRNEVKSTANSWKRLRFHRLK